MVRRPGRHTFVSGDALASISHATVLNSYFVLVKCRRVRRPHSTNICPERCVRTLPAKSCFSSVLIRPQHGLFPSILGFRPYSLPHRTDEINFLLLFVRTLLATARTNSIELLFSSVHFCSLHGLFPLNCCFVRTRHIEIRTIATAMFSFVRAVHQKTRTWNPNPIPTSVYNS